MFELIDMIIVRPIANILFVIYNFVGDFGLAIILFTVLVKLLMWPLMVRQLEQTKKMRDIQPEIAKIKQNCKGNRQMESIQTMDLYKRNNIKPFRSILTLLIQFPIFIALYTAIRVMVMPQPNDNLEIRSYEIVQQDSRVGEVIEQQREYLSDTEHHTYEFHPRLFGMVELDARIVDIFTGSPQGFFILAFAIAATATQFFVMRQQMPSKNGKKRKNLKTMLQEAKAGKEPDQADLNGMMTGSMSKVMPIMLFFIMIPLPGALVFYYLLINIINAIQQKIIFSRQSNDSVKNTSNKTFSDRLSQIQEGEVIKNKKTGTTITRITAKDAKKAKTAQVTKKSKSKTTKKSSKKNTSKNNKKKRR